MSPVRPPRPCSSPGCPRLLTGRSSLCDQHRREDYRRYDQGRGTFKDRGYGSRWPAVRKYVLDHEPLCRVCTSHGRTTAASVVDHIVPKPRGVEEYDLSNLQPLCVPCHGAKSARELNAMRRPR